MHVTEGVDVVGIQTHTVKEDADFNGTIRNTGTFSGKSIFKALRRQLNDDE